MNWYKTSKIIEAKWSWKYLFTLPLFTLATMLGIDKLTVDNMLQKHNGDVNVVKKELIQHIVPQKNYSDTQLGVSPGIQDPSPGKITTSPVKLQLPEKKHQSPGKQLSSPVKQETIHFDVLKQTLERHEGKRNRRYLDTKGIPTIGIGFNLLQPGAKDIINNIGANYNKILSGQQSLSEEQIEKLFKYSLNNAISSAEKIVPNLHQLPAQAQYIVINMSFNLGPTRLSKFKNFIEALKKYDYRTAADQMVHSKWYTQVSNRSKELTQQMRELAK